MGGDMSKQELLQLKDTTKFTLEEIEQWHRKFKADFPKGFITKEAFIEMYGKIFTGRGGKATDGKKMAEHMFRAYDTDGSGEIDFKEFLTTLSVASRGDVDEKLRWSFRVYDVDGNGTVSRDEAYQIISNSYKLRGEEDYRSKSEQAVEQLFSYLKKGEDDELTEEEFVNAAKSSREIQDILQGKW